ncbi:MAG: NifB/NifX family molybdenum-iron cluster-binding protein [Halarcobacter sp.]
MITFPVKTKKENATVSPLFGKAKYFAFYDGESLQIEANPFDNGSSLIDWFKEKGVDDIVIKEMGTNPYKKLKNTNIDIYYAGDEKITTNEIIESYNNKTLKILDASKMSEIIKKHEGSHSHGDHDHKDHHH